MALDMQLKTMNRKPRTALVTHAASGSLPALAVVLIALFGLIVPHHPAFAADTPSLTRLHAVTGIAVDVTASTAAAARDKAIAQAQRAAFSVLFRRLTPAGTPPLDGLSDTDIAGLVRDFEISGEKTSAVRYLGDFTIRFRPEQVRKLLSDRGVPFTEAFRPPMLVLPVLYDGQGARLWDPPNPWFDVWQRRSGQIDLLTLKVPVGNLDDLIAGNVDQVLAGSLDALDRLRQRYDAEGVIVAVARLGAADGRLAIEFREYGRLARPDGPRAGERVFGYIDATSLTLPALAGEGRDAWLVRGRDAVIDKLAERWKRQTAIGLSSLTGRIVVAVSVDDIRQWRKVQQLLAAEPAVTGITVLSLSRHRGRLALDHRGSLGELRQLLEQKGLALSAEPLSLDPSLEGEGDQTIPRLLDSQSPPADQATPPQLVSEPTYLLTLAGAAGNASN